MSLLRIVILAALSFGAAGVGAPIFANDDSMDGVRVPWQAQPPADESGVESRSRNPRVQKPIPPMTPGCPYRGAKLELIV